MGERRREQTESDPSIEDRHLAKCRDQSRIPVADNPGAGQGLQRDPPPPRDVRARCLAG